MEVGDRVLVIVPGDFENHAGVISRITQHSKQSRPHYWVVFDAHPWQKPGIDWAFDKQELTKEDK